MRPGTNDFDPDEKDFVSRVALPTCPDLTLLHAAHEGVLADEKTKQVQAHLQECEVCRTLFADLEAVDFGTLLPAESASIRARIARSAPHAFGPQRPFIVRRWLVPALAVAAAAVIAVVLIKVPKAETPAPEPSIAFVKKPLPEIAVEKLPIRVDPSSLLATRGGSSSTQPSGPELAKALARYQNDDFSGAAQQLKALAEKYPNDGTVRLYLGVSELLLKQNAEASADLTIAARELEGSRQADAQWYLAAAHLHLKQRDAAQPVLQQLCEGKSTYKDQSCKLESELK